MWVCVKLWKMLSLVFLRLTETDPAHGPLSLPCAPVRNSIRTGSKTRPSSGQRARCQVRPLLRTVSAQGRARRVSIEGLFQSDWRPVRSNKCASLIRATAVPVLNSFGYIYSASRNTVTWERKCIQEHRTRKAVFPRNMCFQWTPQTARM